MRNFYEAKQVRLWLIVLGVAVVVLAYFYIQERPFAPSIPALSQCKELKTGTRRIGNRNGIQFNVLTKDFRIIEGTQDMPPFAHGFDLRPEHSDSVLDISFGPQEWEDMHADPDMSVLEHVEKRNALDNAGHQIAEDYWGYLRTRERWRRVRFSGGVIAKYRFVNRKDAELFDRVIASACLLSTGS